MTAKEIAWARAVLGVLQQGGSEALKACLMEAGLMDGNWQPLLQEVLSPSAHRMRRHRSKKAKRAPSVTCDGVKPVHKSILLPASSDSASHVTRHIASHSVTCDASQASLLRCNTDSVANVDTYPESSESDSESESDSDQIKIFQRKRESAEREKEGKVGAASHVTPAASRRQRRIPPTFEPSTQLLAWAALNAPLVNFEDELAVIRDYEFKNPYSDWPAVVRNWLRRAQQQREQFNAKNGIAAPRVFSDDDHSMDGMEGFLL